MSLYDKRRIQRLYSDGKSYVLSSQMIEDHNLHINLTQDSQVCANKITQEEWSSMKQRSKFSLLNEFYGCLGMLSTTSDERNLNVQHCLIFVKEAVSVGTIRKFDIIRVTDVYILQLAHDINVNFYSQQQPGQSTNTSSNQHNDLRKFLSSGNFYFAFSQEPTASFDLTLSSQARHSGHSTEKKFLWNYNLHIPFRRLLIDGDKWLLKIISGYVDIKKVFTLGKCFKVCLISRMSCERVGTRFNCRGVNDDGNCANFVETEQVLFSEDSEEESAFLQLRGSVPVFFQQSGMNVGAHRITVSRGIEACYPAFERHIKSLYQDYGTQIYILNLLGIKGDESFLTECFSRLCKESPFAMNGQLRYTNFDYHQEMKINRHALGEKMWSNLVHELYIENHQKSNTDDMFFYYNRESDNNEHDSVTNKLQTKYIRTNCMDCLDRTNNVQAYIGLEMLDYQLKNFLQQSDTQKIRECRELYRQMWILNGDCISKIYAGTGAIQGKSVTQDISRSLSRAIQNNFLDNTKQDAIDTVLYGASKNYGDLADRIRILMSQSALRLPHPVLRRMIQLNQEYVKQIKCKVCVATWNINGGLSASEMDKLDLNDWLLDGPLQARKTGLGFVEPDAKDLDDVDIFCVGFEEIVDLSATNIVSASDDNSNQWYSKLYKFLQRHGKYVPLIIEPLQLVGVCIFVFVAEKHVSAIRDVSISKTKTGLGGAAGNKGGVLVRMIFYNSSMCFVCAHFAAHQKEIQQRNEDFRQIYTNSEFTGSSKVSVASHDYVFWCGDLNYRIDMDNTQCRGLISENNWQRLLEMDQLTNQHELGRVFEDFIEGPISFPPTYKYNMYEDTYDRSEKCRVPAWTDRVLWKRRKLTAQDRENPNFDIGKCLYYGRADVRLSDHRPVSALIEVEVNKVIPKKQIEVLNKVMKELVGPFQVVLIVKTHTNIMNQMVKDEVTRLFSRYRSFANIREHKSCLFVTYTDGKHAYDAYAQMNNYYIEKYDITLLIKVDNEGMYEKLYEQEMWDCLEVLYYNRHNSIAKEPEIADLLGASFNNEPEETAHINELDLFHVPSHLHTTSTIFHNMHSNNNSRNELGKLNVSNPLHKALSNSNLNDFNDAKYAKREELAIGRTSTKKTMHSAINLLDISNEELPEFGQILPIPNAASQAPPRRPPPPVPAFPSTLPKGTSNQDFAQLVDISQEPESKSQLGFEDDFSRVSFTASTSTPAPPPLPPLPSNLTNKSNPAQPPLFTLGSTEPDSNSEPNTPFPASNDDPFLALASASVTKQTPTMTLTTTSKPQLPPPLPPMPARIQQQSSTTSKSDGSFTSYIQPQQTSGVPPPLPPLPTASLAARVPPPLPQRPQQLDPFGDPFFNPTASQQQQSKPTFQTNTSNSFDPFA